MKNLADYLLMFIITGVTMMLFFSGIKNNDWKSSNVIDSGIGALIPIPDSLFQSGDLIFRDGRGFISNAFRKLSLTDPRYSHAGIIHKENGKTFVYHIIGGEGNVNNLMRKERIGDFCSPLQSNAFGVYRTNLDGKIIDSLAEYYFTKKTEFDTGFDLNTDDKMYCTELLYKILVKVSGQDNFLPLTVFSGIKYESCDNIYLSPQSKKIYSFDYSIKKIQ